MTITCKELFGKAEKTIPVGSTQADVAKIPAKSSLFGLFYSTEDLSPETVEKYLLDPTKAIKQPIMVALVPSQEDWAVQASDSHKITEDALKELELWLPFKDYKKYMHTIVFHPNQILVSRLPKPYYKDTEKRVYVGFLFFVAHLVPYDE